MRFTQPQPNQGEGLCRHWQSMYKNILKIIHLTVHCVPRQDMCQALWEEFCKKATFILNYSRFQGGKGNCVLNYGLVQTCQRQKNSYIPFFVCGEVIYPQVLYLSGHRAASQSKCRCLHLLLSMCSYRDLYSSKTVWLPVKCLHNLLNYFTRIN